MSDPLSTGIAVRGVSKSFNGKRVLHDVTFHAPAGRITAFLGPNGSGKSTTLRIAAGLSRPEAGDVTFGGRHLRDEILPARLVGFLLDPTALHRARTVNETLTLAALTSHVPTSAVAPMLERIGLSAVAKRRVGNLSLGMRQRLALGCALLPEPEYLVMDEPVNGLDVEGVMWVRSIMKEQVAAGGTVLLSSHLLREVEAVADVVVMLDQGRVVAAAAPDQLTHASETTTVCPLDADQLVALLTAHDVLFTRTGSDFHVSLTPREVGVLTAANNVPVSKLIDASGANLEQAFLTLTTGEYAAR